MRRSTILDLPHPEAVEGRTPVFGASLAAYLLQIAPAMDAGLRQRPYPDPLIVAADRAGEDVVVGVGEDDVLARDRFAETPRHLDGSRFAAEGQRLRRSPWCRLADGERPRRFGD